jgi:hypothetical protein
MILNGGCVPAQEALLLGLGLLIGHRPAKRFQNVSDRFHNDLDQGAGASIGLPGAAATARPSRSCS